MAATFTPLLAGELSFDKQTLTKDFVAEGCAVADFDHDGQVDVAAGWFIWKGPDFKQRVAYAVEPSHDKGPNKTPFNGATGYSDYFISYAYDFNADGWQDILVFGFPGDPALVYENPKGKAGPWPVHNIFDVADGVATVTAIEPAFPPVFLTDTGRTRIPDREAQVSFLARWARKGE